MGTGVGARQSRVWVCRKAARVIKRRTGFQRERKFRKVPEAFRRKMETGGRWKMQEGGFAADRFVAECLDILQSAVAASHP
jgi:hypothetical protein